RPAHGTRHAAGAERPGAGEDDAVARPCSGLHPRGLRHLSPPRPTGSSPASARSATQPTSPGWRTWCAVMQADTERHPRAHGSVGSIRRRWGSPTRDGTRLMVAPVSLCPGQLHVQVTAIILAPFRVIGGASVVGLGSRDARTGPA